MSNYALDDDDTGDFEMGGFDKEKDEEQMASAVTVSDPARARIPSNARCVVNPSGTFQVSQ